jgi:hypothetical protein
MNLAAAGITDKLWSVEDIVALVEASEPKPGKRGPLQQARCGLVFLILALGLDLLLLLGGRLRFPGSRRRH